MAGELQAGSRMGTPRGPSGSQPPSTYRRDSGTRRLNHQPNRQPVGRPVNWGPFKTRFLPYGKSHGHPSVYL